MSDIDHSEKTPEEKAEAAPKAKAKKPRKAKAPKAKAAKKEGEKPTTGQSGPKIDLDPKADRKEVGRSAALSDKESKVLAAIRASRSEDGIKIADLAAAAFPSKTKAQGNSWVRNSLRRLVCARLVKKAGRGAYKKAA